MLEQLHRTPEERRKTEIFLHLGVIAFALYSLTELVAALGAAPVIAGTATALCVLLYSRLLRSRWHDGLREAGSRSVEHRDSSRHLRAV